LEEVNELLNVVPVVVSELVSEGGVVKVVRGVRGVVDVLVPKAPDEALDRLFELKAAE
jgi:hypothetical protein